MLQIHISNISVPHLQEYMIPKQSSRNQEGSQKMVDYMYSNNELMDRITDFQSRVWIHPKQTKQTLQSFPLLYVHSLQSYSKYLYLAYPPETSMDSCILTTTQSGSTSPEWLSNWLPLTQLVNAGAGWGSGLDPERSSNVGKSARAGWDRGEPEKRRDHPQPHWL